MCSLVTFQSWTHYILWLYSLCLGRWRRDREFSDSTTNPGWSVPCYLGFPGRSAGKESACNAGDLSLIPRSGRSAGEGIGYPLQYSRASLMTQLVKNPLEMWQAWVWSLGWDNPLEKGKATHSSIWAWRIPPGRKELDTTELLSLFFLCYLQGNPLPSAHILLILIFFLFLNFTILYWFCQISKWIRDRHTCVPYPEPSSLLPPHTIPLGPVSCIEPGLATRFIYDIIRISMPFSHIIPPSPSPSPTESKRLFLELFSISLPEVGILI